MVKRVSFWTVLFHLFVLVFCVSYISTTESGNRIFLITVLLAGSTGALIRNKITRLLSFSFLVIPAMIGSYQLVELIASLIREPYIQYDCFGQITDRSIEEVGLLGILLVFPVMFYRIIQDWNEWFSIKEHLVFTSLLIVLIVLISFDVSFMINLGEWIILSPEPELRIPTCFY